VDCIAELIMYIILVVAASLLVVALITIVLIIYKCNRKLQQTQRSVWCLFWSFVISDFFFILCHFFLICVYPILPHCVGRDWWKCKPQLKVDRERASVNYTESSW